MRWGKGKGYGLQEGFEKDRGGEPLGTRYWRGRSFFFPFRIEISLNINIDSRKRAVYVRWTQYTFVSITECAPNFENEFFYCWYQSRECGLFGQKEILLTSEFYVIGQLPISSDSSSFKRVAKCQRLLIADRRDARRSEFHISELWMGEECFCKSSYL